MGLLDLLANVAFKAVVNSGKAPVLNDVIEKKAEEVGKEMEKRETEINNKINNASTETLKKVQSSTNNEYIKDNISSELHRRGE